MEPFSIAHYEVTAKIGSGAMGDVFGAFDTKLNRHVAIKVLPKSIAGNARSLARFEREAQLLAALNHPNIATIHGIENIEETKAIVLELIEGDTLQDRLESGPLPLEEALPIFRQIASALEAAHEKGIVHRDLKPANVKFTAKGDVKVLDFGLAKAVEGARDGASSTEVDADAPTLPVETTMPGMVVGTPAYMSPEQTRGQPVDKRTNVWAFGCCLYEALTGRKPFKAQTVSDMLAEVLKSDPDYTIVPPETPGDILSLLRRCLEKEPRRRLRDIGDIAIRLEETTESSRLMSPSTASESTMPARQARSKFVIGIVVSILVLSGLLVWLVPQLSKQGSATEPTKPRAKKIQKVVVLPFEDITRENQEIVDGMTVLLTTLLGERAGELQVTGRTSAWQYKGRNTPIPQIARELDVDWVIEGSVTKGKEQMLITASLVDGASGKQTWTKLFRAQKLSSLPEDVVLEIANQIGTNVVPERTALSSQNSKAIYYYLQGLAQKGFSEESLGNMLRFSQEAINEDKEFAEAYALKARALTHLLYWGGWARNDASIESLQKTLRKVQTIGPNLQESHRLAGRIALYLNWDFPSAEKHLLQALEGNRSDAIARDTYSELLGILQRNGESIVQSSKARDIDPRNGHYAESLAWGYFRNGDHDKSIETANLLAEIEPESFRPYHVKAFSLIALKRDSEAEESLRTAFEKSGRAPFYMARLGYALGVMGKREEARKLLAQLELVAKDEPEKVQALHRGLIYLGLGDDDKALKWFNKSFEDRDMAMIYLGSNFYFDSERRRLRDNPKYQELLRRIGLPE